MKSNGKIAIAIVAMFVVALSIVGITYAYFVSGVQTNTTDKVEVQAGVLQVDYEAGNSLDTTGISIVPGWKNDGKMIYHPTYSNNNGQITAVSIDDAKVEDTTYDGNVKNPITFTITNTSEPATKEAHYGIRLTGITAENFTIPKENVKVYLTGTSGTLANNVTVASLKSDTNGNLYVSTPISITNTAHSFSLIVEYVETKSPQTEQAQKINFTVEVVGLNLVDGNYVTSSGANWVTSLTA